MQDRRSEGDVKNPVYLEFKAAMDSVLVRSREMVAAAREAALSLSLSQSQSVSSSNTDAKANEALRTSYLARLLARGEIDPAEGERELVNLLFAGVDTTTHVLMWIVLHLAQHPEKQRKLREELLKVLGPDGDVTPHSLVSLKYLDACVRESHRLTPPTIGKNSISRIQLDSECLC